MRTTHLRPILLFGCLAVTTGAANAQQPQTPAGRMPPTGHPTGFGQISPYYSQGTQGPAASFPSLQRPRLNPLLDLALGNNNIPAINYGLLTLPEIDRRNNYAQQQTAIDALNRDLARIAAPPVSAETALANEQYRREEKAFREKMEKALDELKTQKKPASSTFKLLNILDGLFSIEIPIPPPPPK